MESIAPGIVIYRKILSEQQQQNLCQLVMDYSQNPEHSFKKLTGEYNSTPSRGRIYTSIVDEKMNTRDEFLTFSKICQDFTEEAHKIDSSILPYSPTHLLMLLYSGNRGMGFHRDNGKNDGDGDYPIVSFSLGNSCDFIFKFDNGEEKTVKLMSGDGVLFGGENRKIRHSVDNITFDCPLGLQKIIKRKARINLTFRYVPSVIGKEEDFKYFDAYKVSMENRKKRNFYRKNK